jgi:hypothetical protein
MDTDHPTMSIKSYEPSMGKSQGISSREFNYPNNSRRTGSSSAFERLPLEIRQTVYSHLGYPVGSKTWRATWDCETTYHSSTSRSMTFTSRLIHARVLRFRYWRWDQSLFSTVHGRGIRVDVEHALLAEGDT